MPNTWFKTDDMQFCKKINEESYFFAEIVEQIEGKLYQVKRGALDWSDYTKEELLEYLSGYSYDSFEHVQESYGEEWKQIILECVFETSGDFDEEVFEDKESASLFLSTKEKDILI